jgi:cytochrome c-type biogenesis protein CcmH
MRMIAVMALLWLLQAPAAETQISDRAREIEDELMAPCCWSQPVSQHYSREAAAIREGVRTMLLAGKTKTEILDYYASKYGERVLARPRARGFNLLVYLMPWVAVTVGSVLLALTLKRFCSSKPADVSAPLSIVPERYAAEVERELSNMG